jgi:hypothetical protein
MVSGKGDTLFRGFCLELCEIGVNGAVLESEGHLLPVLKT